MENFVNEIMLESAELENRVLKNYIRNNVAVTNEAVTDMVKDKAGEVGAFIKKIFEKVVKFIEDFTLKVLSVKDNTLYGGIRKRFAGIEWNDNMAKVKFKSEYDILAISKNKQVLESLKTVVNSEDFKDFQAIAANETATTVSEAYNNILSKLGIKNSDSVNGLDTFAKAIEAGLGKHNEKKTYSLDKALFDEAKALATDNSNSGIVKFMDVVRRTKIDLKKTYVESLKKAKETLKEVDSENVDAKKDAKAHVDALKTQWTIISTVVVTMLNTIKGVLSTLGTIYSAAKSKAKKAKNSDAAEAPAANEEPEADSASFDFELAALEAFFM